MKKWYVVNAKSRQEKVAKQRLFQFGVEAFFPECQENRLIRGKHQVVTVPLFPGYLFARFDVMSHYRAVRYSHGVRGVVSYGSDPVEMDESVIIMLKSNLENGHVNIRPPAFKPGQPVRIQSGYFEGLEAVFEREVAAQHRVILLLNTLHQHKVVIGRECIEAL